MTQQLRKSVLAEEQIIASKRRFGLFSQPPPLSVGDNSAYMKLQHARGENGKPITNPPQMTGGRSKSGKTKSSYFGVPESIHQKDPYKQTFKLECEYQKKMHTKADFYQYQFKPASGFKTSMKAAYPYIQQKPKIKKGIQRDQTGRVKTQPRNFTTNPISKVETQFFKHPKHMKDEYERQREAQKRYRQIQQSKLQKQSWKSSTRANKPFQKVSSAFGEDPATKEMINSLQAKKTRCKTLTTSVTHEAPFKPAINNKRGAIGKYPQGIPAPQKKEQRKRIKTQQAGGKQTWKPNPFTYSRPTPSICYNPKNLKLNRARAK